MIRKTILVLFLIYASISLTACVSVPYDKPYGVWQNETIGLTLDINPKVASQGPCTGIYIVDGEEIEVEIHFGHGGFGRPGPIIVQDAKSDTTLTYFSGDFKVKDDKLHYSLRVPWEEPDGTIDTIIFDLIEEYEELSVE